MKFKNLLKRKKITRGEISYIVRDVLISISTFLIVIKLQDWLFNSLNPIIQMVVGVLLMLFVLWFFQLTKR
jgi:Flp pilus assembly protein TadB